jgi:hypothetical protein
MSMFNVANYLRRDIAVQKIQFILHKNWCLKRRVCHVLPEYGRDTEKDKFCNFREPVSELIILTNDTQKYDPNKFFF